jgi:hypothetical protein
MTYILTCGCESEYGGFPSEWDGETRECEPAVFYGCLCDKHYGEYDARPAQYTPRELSDEEIAYIAMHCSNMDIYGNSKLDEVAFAKELIKKASGK